MVDDEEKKIYVYNEEEEGKKRKCDVTQGNVNIKSVVARIHVIESIFRSFTCKAKKKFFPSLIEIASL